MSAELATDVLAWLSQNVAASAHLTLDSRRVGAGDVFLAYQGARSDGRDHIEQALAAGACAVLFEGGDARADGLEQTLAERGIAALAVRGLKSLLGTIASGWYRHPSRALTVIAVTGTNGKTSCTQWLADALTAQGRPCAVIGTLGIRMPATGPAAGHVATGLTTPDAVALHRSLAEMRERGVEAVAIEASSIGLEEGRLDGLEIDVAAFTNLTRDHLDYHGDMARYEAAKARLFDWPGMLHAVVNLDDAAGARLAAYLAPQTRTGELSLRGFSLQASNDAAGVPVLRATDVQAASQGMVFTLEADDASVQIATPLLGAHNVANLLTVAGVLLELGWPLQRVAAALLCVQAAAGRLESVAAPGRSAGQGTPLVVVDYAHSPDALERVLEALEPVARARGGRRICVFGCGGDRDAGKRPQMAKIAYEHADEVVVTSDNPRSEDPRAIVDQIVAGLPAGAQPRIEIDRARAIRQVVLAAAPDDVVLLAGKGHETYQEIGQVRYPFSDVAQAREALADYPAADAGVGMMTLAEAAASVQGVLHAASAAARQRFVRVNTDSRDAAPGDLFVALAGERFDGHDYVPAMAAAGAAAAIVQRPLDGVDLPQIVVADTRAALGQLARAWRDRFAIPLIAVTGSNGKTTTKEMIASVLAAWQGEEHRLATRGNFNNEIGLPLTLLRLTPEHRCGVLELGMNHPGEIARLAWIAAPKVALVNNAQREHQEFMHSVEAVARENGAVIEGLAADGVAVFPGDDLHAPIWETLAGARSQLRFGLDGTADVRAEDVRLDAFETRFRLATPSGSADVALSAAGMHNVRNALAAAACALAIDVPLATVVQGLQAFAPVKGRMQRHALRGGALLIDDTYNANPDSVRAAIDVLATLPAPRALVLGDMGEVGDKGPEMHREVGAYARERGIDALFTLGEATRATAEAFGGAGLHADSADQLAPAVRAAGPASILVKGSRFMRMERVVAALADDTAPASLTASTTHAA